MVFIAETFFKDVNKFSFSPNNYDFRGPSQKVRLGTKDLKDVGDGLQEKLISERISHPEYKPPFKYNDIGLIRLHSPVNFTLYVYPACLSTKQLIPERGATATGFGKLSYGMYLQIIRYINKICMLFFPGFP